MIENIKKRIDTLLKEKNFETLFLEDVSKKYCFDSLVKATNSNSIFLIKVFPNIDNLPENIINSIKNLSLLLNSKPLLIGIKNRYQNLDDNTIYIRKELPFITFNTLERILTLNEFPTILARRGGGVIFLNGDLMKTLREQKNISRKEISEQLGITKRTICSYENESMRPSQKIAEKIHDILKDKSIFRNINLFEWQLKIHFNQEVDQEKRELSEFEVSLQDIFKHIGISTLWFDKGQFPFKLYLSSNNNPPDITKKKDFYPLFSGIYQENEINKVTKSNINHLIKFAKLFNKNALFIVNDSFKIPDLFKNSQIPIIKTKNLEKMDNEDDFVDIFKEK